MGYQYQIQKYVFESVATEDELLAKVYKKKQEDTFGDCGHRAIWDDDENQGYILGIAETDEDPSFYNLPWDEIKKLENEYNIKLTKLLLVEEFRYTFETEPILKPYFDKNLVEWRNGEV
jgi:hypothetical protein